MRHYSCDVCTRDFPNNHDLRYTIRMEVVSNLPSSELTEADLDQDQVEVMSEILEELAEAEFDTVEMPALGSGPPPAKLVYDLCPDCFKRFLADPLNREQVRRMQFSKN